MTRRRSTIVAAAAAALLLAATPARPGLAVEPSLVEAPRDAMTPLGLRAGELGGATLHGADGEALGEIEKVLASRDGRVAGLAVQIEEGVLGISDRAVVLRFDQVHRAGDRVATLLTRALLRAQPPWYD